MNQLRITAEQDAKVRHLLTLSGSVLVVAVAMSGLVAGRPQGKFLGWFDLDVYGFLISIVVSFVSSFWAFLLFARAYNGSRRHPYRSEAGWHPRNLKEAADAEDTLTEIRHSTIHGVQRWYESNLEVIERSTKIRKRGTWLVLLSGASLAISLIYAVGASFP